MHGESDGPGFPPLDRAPWRDGETLALCAGSRRWTYAELSSAADARARWLRDRGLDAGQIVLCPAAPAAELVLMQHALARAGAALLPIPSGSGRAQQELAVAAGAEWLWRPPPDGPALAPAPTGAERPPVSAVSGPDRVEASRPFDGPGPSPVAAAEPDPLALLVATSGSTAEPKIAMLTAAGLAASAAAVSARLDLRAGNAWLGVLPRHHVGGLAITWRCALAGATLVVQERFDARTVRAAMDAADPPITHLSLVPPMLARLLEVDATPPETLRAVLLGGQPLDPGLARRAVAAGWPLYLGYGMTETGSMIASGPVGGDGAAMLKPVPGIELDCPLCIADRSEFRGARFEEDKTDQQVLRATNRRLACDRYSTEAGSERPSRSTEPGAPPNFRPLRLRGPMVMAGYANPQRRPGEGLTAQGWLVTGDLACREPDGRLRILGRADDCLVIGGVNVLPAQVEAALAAAPDVGEVAIVGRPEPVWGHRLIALYTGPAEPARLDAWCRAHLPSPQRPRGFRRIARLPLLISGKIDRQALAIIAAASGAER